MGGMQTEDTTSKALLIWHCAVQGGWCGGEGSAGLWTFHSTDLLRSSSDETQAVLQVHGGTPRPGRSRRSKGLAVPSSNRHTRRFYSRHATDHRPPRDAGSSKMDIPTVAADMRGMTPWLASHARCPVSILLPPLCCALCYRPMDINGAQPSTS